MKFVQSSSKSLFNYMNILKFYQLNNLIQIAIPRPTIIDGVAEFNGGLIAPSDILHTNSSPIFNY